MFTLISTTHISYITTFEVLFTLGDKVGLLAYIWVTVKHALNSSPNSSTFKQLCIDTVYARVYVKGLCLSLNFNLVTLASNLSVLRCPKYILTMNT